MAFSWCKKKANKIFVTRLGLQKLIINEKGVSVETFKKTEYTPSKLHENKQRLKEAMKDTIKGYKQTIFVSDSSTYLACLEERRRQQVIYKKYVIKS